jgi:protein gp37
MADKSKIEWTDATWNPIRGCSRVSEGCRNCYAETVANRFCGPGSAYEGVVQIDANGKGLGKWNGQIKFVEKRLLDPLHWKQPRKIFVNSMSDLFHENVTDEMLDRIFAVMALCPQHTFQILTKRPERMLAYLEGLDVDGHDMAGSDGAMRWATEAGGFFSLGKRVDRLIAEFICDAHEDTCLFDDTDPDGERIDEFYCLKPIQWPLPNVWLGVSVENQPAADERIPLLLKTPAAVIFISAEPLLGALNLMSNLGGTAWIGGQRGCGGLHHGDGSPDCPSYLHHHHDDRCARGIDWVIVGGESGPGARPMHPDWARSLRDQCVAAGVPFFFKQWGEWSHPDYKKPAETPGRYALMPQDGTTGMYGTTFTEIDHYPRHFTSFGSIVRERVGKKAAGDLLDGVQWHQFPAVGVTA